MACIERGGFRWYYEVGKGLKGAQGAQRASEGLQGAPESSGMNIYNTKRARRGWACPFIPLAPWHLPLWIVRHKEYYATYMS